MAAAVDNVLGRLRGVRSSGEGRWQAQCPAHDDRNPSLSISIGDDGRVLLHCHSGCELADICSAMDLALTDLFPPNRKRASSGRKRIVATYDYQDAHGAQLYQVVRFDPKGFRQRRPDGNGGWIWSLGRTPRVLYRLPELLSSDTYSFVYLVEGEKDVDRLTDSGVISTTNPGGAGKWSKVDDVPLHKRHVAVIPDSDEAGRQHAEDVATRLHGKAESVRVVNLPGDAKDVSDYLDAGGDLEDLWRLAESTPLWEPSKAPSFVSGGGDQRPKISARPLEDRTKAVLNALEAANDPPLLFVRQGALVRVRRDENGNPTIQTIGVPELRHRIAEVVRFPQALNPPRVLVENILAAPRWPMLPALVGITEVPVLRADGSILSRPGYDKATGLLYVPNKALELVAVPESPTAEELTAAVELLAEAIVDFPFIDEAARANSMALMLTPIVRPVIEGQVPLALVDAPQRRTGKGLLTKLVSTIALGRPVPMMTCPQHDDEWCKKITAKLLEGPSIVCIDNVVRPLRSEHLAAMLTTDTWEDRELGHSRMVRMPQRAVWMATGNNLKVAGDLAPRCFWIRIDAKVAEPWKRDCFRHPDLVGWARENRGRLVAALLTVARSWVLAGRPAAPVVPVLGGFDAWVIVVGGILAHAGVGGFLGNADELVNSADDDASQWRGFLEAWRDHVGGTAVTAASVEDAMKEGRLDGTAEGLKEGLPDELADAFASPSRSFTRSLGRALRRIEGRRYTADGLRVERGEAKHKRAATWRVVTDG